MASCRLTSYKLFSRTVTIREKEAWIKPIATKIELRTLHCAYLVHHSPKEMPPKNGSPDSQSTGPPFVTRNANRMTQSNRIKSEQQKKMRVTHLMRVATDVLSPWGGVRESLFISFLVIPSHPCINLKKTGPAVHCQDLLSYTISGSSVSRGNLPAAYIRPLTA